MSLTSKRRIVIGYEGDFDADYIYDAVNNASPGGENWLYISFSGDQTVTIPVVTGVSVPTAATIIPPSGNTQTLRLKKVAGDTGIKIHKTDPTSIALDPTETNFIINSSGAVSGLRVIWS